MRPRGEGRGRPWWLILFPRAPRLLAAEPAWAGKSGAWPSQKVHSDLRRVFWVLGLGLLGHSSLSVTFPLFSAEPLASYQLPSSWLTIITYTYWIVYIHIWFFIVLGEGGWYYHLILQKKILSMAIWLAIDLRYHREEIQNWDSNYCWSAAKTVA